VLAALISAVSAGGVAAQQQQQHQQQQPLVHFDAETPITLSPGGSADVAVFNDSDTSFVIQATAALDPTSDDTAGQRAPVAIAFDLGGGFVEPAARTTLSSTERMRIRLTAPANASPGAAGWLTVVAKSDAQTMVARRAIRIALPTPTVNAWSVTSIQEWPWQDDGGAIDPPLPLSPPSGCASLGDPGTVLVSADRTVSITSMCENGYLQLQAGDFSPGTYKGKLTVGSATVDVEIRRTMAIRWPIALIVAGIVFAILSQGRIDQGWRVQQRRWLRRMPRDAAKADAQYAVAAREMPWEKYALEPVIEKDVAATRQRLQEIGRSRRFLLRFLPWPEGFMATEREEVRKRIAELDELVRKWPAMPRVFGTASARVNRERYYVKRAPRLVERALGILGAVGLPVNATELVARCAEAAALPDALDVVDDLEQLDTYLTALERQTTPLLPQDLETRVRARQYERQASATLAELGDSTKVPDEVGRLVERAARLAARLPKPTGLTRDRIRTAGVDAAAGVFVGLPLALFRRATALFGGEGVALGHSALILVTLAVGVLSGLAALYVGKAWGASWTDYAAAFVWGYAASTVIDPIVSAVRQLGTRPGDAAEAKTKTAK
jgi:hypothetical protein